VQPAWQIAKQWHEKYIPEQPFSEAVLNCFKEGLLYSSPEIFLCAREVLWDGETAYMSNRPNAWFVHMAASSGHANPVKAFMQAATKPHRWVLWHRRNEERLRVFNWESLARKVGL
jgi:hypothetical protein